MCGIFACVGEREAQPLVLEGLRRLEYRGYDSAGIATLDGTHMHVRKCAGRVADLARRLGEQPAPGRQGIGHTRWATHGPPTDANAHPHVGGAGETAVAVVHNGVIENYAALRRLLEGEGVTFASDTDTEVIAHLIAHHLNGDLAAATHKALALVRGTYAVVVCTPHHPGLLVGACSGAPLVLGLGRGENFLASDPGALAGLTGEAVYLHDGQVCALRAHDWSLLENGHTRVPARVWAVPADAPAASPGDFGHFMLKEIHDQPAALENTL